MTENETNTRRAAVLRVYASALLNGDGSPGSLGDIGDVLWCQVYADSIEQGEPIENPGEIIPIVEGIARAMPSSVALIDDWLAELRQAQASQTPATADRDGGRHV